METRASYVAVGTFVLLLILGLLKAGDNVIAIRVQDTGGRGGIVEGPVELGAAVAALGSEHVTGEALRVDAHQRRPALEHVVV